MKFLNLLFIALLAITIGACGTATETKKDGTKDATSTEKKDDAKAKDKKPAETGKIAKTPKEAVENLIEGIKAKDEAAIKAALSSQTLKFFEESAKVEKKTIYELLTADGEEEMKIMPDMRNEKIVGDKATAEIKEPDQENWDTINFVKENGSWKIAIVSKEEADKMKKELEKLKEGLEDDTKEKAEDK